MSLQEPATKRSIIGLYRVARRDDPLRFGRIDPEHVLSSTAGGRFNVPGAGVLYVGTTLEGCYAETLRDLRPSAKARVAAARNGGLMVPGGVPAAWRTGRVEVQVLVTNGLPFLDVDEPETHEYLTTVLAGDLSALGTELIDVGVVRGPNRLITRRIAAWAYEARDDAGNPRFSGIRYMSRYGNHECWAVFEGSEIVEIARNEILKTNDALRVVARQFNLTLH